MTEQPAETEQQFLGNDVTAPAAIVDYAQTEGIARATSPQRQHYAPGAHRLPVARLVPPTTTKLGQLFDALVAAEKDCKRAKDEAIAAEENLKAALAEEARLEEIWCQAQQDLLNFAGKEASA